MHELIFNDNNRLIIEKFENSNVRIVNYVLTGKTEIEFNPNCDPKVKEMYERLSAGAKDE